MNEGKGIRIVGGIAPARQPIIDMSFQAGPALNEHPAGEIIFRVDDSEVLRITRLGELERGDGRAIVDARGVAETLRGWLHGTERGNGLRQPTKPNDLVLVSLTDERCDGPITNPVQGNLTFKTADVVHLRVTSCGHFIVPGYPSHRDPQTGLELAWWLARSQDWI